MQDSEGEPRHAGEILLAVGVSAGLVLVRQYGGYSLFHVLVELFAVVVASGIFIVTWNTRRLLDNGYLLVLGIAFLFVGAVDLLHLLAYKGMGGLLGPDQTNLPTQLWLVARYLQAISMLVAPAFLTRRVRPLGIVAAFGGVATLGVASVFWGIFPSALTSAGLTPFKIGSEFAVSGILLVAAVLLWRRRERFETGVLELLLASIGTTIASEMAFTLYTDPFGALNLLGHILKVFAFYFIYKAIVVTALQRPFSILFREISEREAALADSEERFRATFEQAIVGIAHADLEGRWLRVNARLSEITGYTKEELLGLTFRDVSYPEDLPEDVEQFDRLVEGEIADYTLEKRAVSKDGTVFWVSLRRSAVRDERGKPKYIVSIVEDIDERKHAEDAQRRIADTLQSALLAMPDSLPRVDFASQYRSSDDLARIGGDFYDAFDLGGGRIGFTLGDVSGKGLDAATITAAARSTLRAFAYLSEDPAVVLAEANAVLFRQLTEERFVTALFATLDTASGALRIAAAGHPAPMRCQSAACMPLELPANPPLGLFDAVTFEGVAGCLSPGEAVVIYSDGVLDARDGADFFGEERLSEVLASHASGSPSEMVASVLAAVDEFTHGVRTDDVALAAFRLVGEAGCRPAEEG